MYLIQSPEKVRIPTDHCVSGNVLSALNKKPCFDEPEFRQFRATDRLKIVELLSFLPSLYPNADEWLSRRLDDVLLGVAHCRVVESKQEIIAVLIEKKKANCRIKVSTFYVREDWRGRGIGTKLLLDAYRVWRKDNAAEVYVTVASQISSILRPLLLRFGFIPRWLELNRYGPQRHEVIYCCNLENTHRWLPRVSQVSNRQISQR